ncbi:RBBP9/YdeN family alpha/beta hydrolase [Psychromonas sp. PT13]|uniref:RBBP9/YdeN family alpha/beta hydrolase n=1 Tax=Psychromonas sp. PT13 TaxID=3439547 RepID=UPI003EBBE361
MFTTIFVSGYGNSTDGHWQDLWHKQLIGSHWVEQDNWDSPNREDWVDTLNTLVQSISGPILFITHSLGGSTVIEWAKQYSANIIGALIVAVPDVNDPHFPTAISGYQQPPLAKLPFPSRMLSSTNDPYSTFERAEYFAAHWGSDIINMGDLGHINISSKIGDWPEGKKQLTQFIDSLTH